MTEIVKLDKILLINIDEKSKTFASKISNIKSIVD